MLKIRINGEQRDAEARDLEPWINQQINRRRADGVGVCVYVDIDADGVRLCLASSGCGGGGGWRALTSAEQAVLDLWRDSHMSEPDFTGGNLIAFLHRLRRVVNVAA